MNMESEKDKFIDMVVNTITHNWAGSQMFFPYNFTNVIGGGRNISVHIDEIRDLIKKKVE